MPEKPNESQASQEFKNIFEMLYPLYKDDTKQQLQKDLNFYEANDVTFKKERIFIVKELLKKL